MQKPLSVLWSSGFRASHRPAVGGMGGLEGVRQQGSGLWSAVSVQESGALNLVMLKVPESQQTHKFFI